MAFGNRQKEPTLLESITSCVWGGVGWDLVLEKSDTLEKSQLLECTHIPGIISCGVKPLILLGRSY